MPCFVVQQSPAPLNLSYNVSLNVSAPWHLDVYEIIGIKISTEPVLAATFFAISTVGLAAERLQYQVFVVLPGLSTYLLGISAFQSYNIQIHVPALGQLALPLLRVVRHAIAIPLMSYISPVQIVRVRPAVFAIAKICSSTVEQWPWPDFLAHHGPQTSPRYHNLILYQNVYHRRNSRTTMNHANAHRRSCELSYSDTPGPCGHLFGQMLPFSTLTMCQKR